MMSLPILMQTGVLVCVGSSLVWVDEDFESYPNTGSAVTVWSIDRVHEGQNTILDQSRSARHGTKSLKEPPNWATRNVYVFDKLNAVTGTDETPLLFSFDLYIHRDVGRRKYETFRTCALLNTDNGQSIVVGPRGGKTFELFDGIRWHRLTFAPPPTTGWTHFELEIRTHAIIVGVSNARGGGYETFPRAYQGGVGACAIGSGISNMNCKTLVDNVRVEGGTLVACTRPAGAPPVGDSPRQQLLIERIRSAVQASYAGSVTDSLKQIESLLDEALAASQSADETQRSTYMRLLPWIYGCVADVKQRAGQSREEIQAVFYEAILKAPDGFGVGGAVDYLAQTLSEPQRSRFLWQLARDYPNQAAGRAAARRLTSTSIGDGPRDIEELAALVARGSGTCVPAEALRAWLAHRPSSSQPAQQLAYVLVGMPPSVAEPLLADYGRKLIARGHHDALELLADWLTAFQVEGACLDGLRVLLYRSRVDRGDLLGALAAVSDLPLGRERAAFIARCRQWRQPEVIRRGVQAWLAAARRVGYLGAPADTESLRQYSPEQQFRRALARAVRQVGLDEIAAVVFQEATSLPETVSAVTDAPLRPSFGWGDAEPERLVRFWHGQFLLQQGNLAGAHVELEAAAASNHAPLRAQALFDLARVHERRSSPRRAAEYLQRCEDLLRTATPVVQLRSRIDRALRHEGADAQCYTCIERLWRTVNGAGDARQVVSALLKIAQIESSLGEPRRAAEALEIAVTKYPDAPAAPEVMRSLVDVYENRLGEPEKARPFREVAARRYGEYLAN